MITILKHRPEKLKLKPAITDVKRLMHIICYRQVSVIGSVGNEKK